MTDYTAFRVRAAVLGDAEGINEIYNPVIRDSAATFEVKEYNLDQRIDWMQGHLSDERHPVYVAEGTDGVIAGFACASRFDPREAYETSVKTSVFVRPDNAGSGVGRALYQALFRALDGVDVHRAYGLIVAPNPASVALHLSSGFSHISTLNEVGRKFGRFHDVMWFEKRF